MVKTRKTYWDLTLEERNQYDHLKRKHGVYKENIEKSHQKIEEAKRNKRPDLRKYTRNVEQTILENKQKINHNRRKKQKLLEIEDQFGINGTIGPAPGFTWNEVHCKDGTPVPDSLKANAVAVARGANTGRAIIMSMYGADDVIIIVHSWYRTPSHNSKIGGASNSYHLRAMAIDISVVVRVNGKLKMVPHSTVQNVFINRVGTIKGIGRYASFTHIDVRSYNSVF